jgi:hypothetical protein
MIGMILPLEQQNKDGLCCKSATTQAVFPAIHPTDTDDDRLPNQVKNASKISISILPTLAHASDEAFFRRLKN